MLPHSFALIVTGAPGCGKATLLQNVLLTFANNRQWRQRVRARIPIFVEVREVARHLQARTEPTLPKLLETILKKDRRTADIGKKLPKGWLEKTLRSGRCILLWDGLDEVADVRERSKVAAWLDRIPGSPDWRRNISLVTARPAGYLNAPLDPSRVLEVQPFTFEDTRRFIGQWYHANEVVASGNKDDKAVRRRAADEARALLAALQDHPRLGDLTSNPLLLTMICMVNRYHGGLPGSRGQLYAEICQVLLERWRQQRGFNDEYSANQKLQVLRPLAAWMMGQETKEVVTEALLKVIAEPLGRIGVAAGREPALAFLKQLQDGSGLLLERELDTWGFAHLTFQEYLCAEEWVSLPAIAPLDWDSRVTESWWREALLLYASRATDASPLVMAALDQGSPEALALVMRLHGEKLNLDVKTRERVELAVVTALASRDEAIFRPAGEAWLHHQQEANYRRLDGTTEISGWVTQAEFQTFLRSDMVANWPFGHVPASWSQGWFQTSPKDPVLGIHSRMASTYVAWLSELFSAFNHRLPRPEECEAGLDWLTWVNDGSSNSLNGAYTPETQVKMAGWLSAHPEMNRKANKWNLKHSDILYLLYEKNSKESNIKLPIFPDMDHALSYALAISSALALALDVAHDLAHDLACALLLDRDCDLELVLNIAQSRALTLALDLARDLVLGRELSFDADHLDKESLHVLNRKIHDLRRQPGVNGRRARCLSPLLALWEPNVNLTMIADAYRRFWVACFDAIREHNPKLLTNEISGFEALMRVLVARADGELPTWEGLMVVRERRT